MRLIILLLWGALCTLQAIVLDEANILKPEVEERLTQMSAELEARTGVKAHLLTHLNPDNLTLSNLAGEYFEQRDEFAVLVLVPKKAGEKAGKVDLFLSSPDLCDKSEVLSPLPNTGSILPILVANKAEDIYNAAMLNGFADICERIAANKGSALTSQLGNENRTTLNIVRYFVYGFLLFGVILFAYKSLKAKQKSKI